MKLAISIPELRCGEETNGAGDDEILLFVAVVPVDTTERIWTYADRWTDAAYKYLDNVDTGEVHRFLSFGRFPDPIAFTQEILPGRAAEIWLVIGEYDGTGTPTDIYHSLRTQLAERCTPGVQVGGRGDIRLSGRDWDDLHPGGLERIQVLGRDVFTINLAQPLAGAIDPFYQLLGNPITAPQQADGIYKNQNDGWMSETRTYRHEGQDSRYTLDVEYRLID